MSVGRTDPFLFFEMEILLYLTSGFREVFAESKNLGECRAEARTSKSLL
jgi:hypothetical protein